tara:strand:- start:2155 stop:2958 length:804 start_codon:yes stop_codon:yes gene_type:complete
MELQKHKTDLPSFGGQSLQDNLQKAELALEATQHLQQIWNHSHSQWSWRHLNLHYLHPFKNLRQIAAELSRKGDALNEARWKYAEQNLKVGQLEEELSGDLEKWTRLKKEVALGKAKSYLSRMLTAVDGCLKDILSLQDLYQQLKAQVGEFDENDVEEAESKAHLQRSLAQSIRDVRQSGAITKGEQEYLEQIGVNPGKVQALIRNYVADEEKEQAPWGTEELMLFVRRLSDELIDNYQVDHKRMELQGFIREHNREFSRNGSNNSL